MSTDKTPTHAYAENRTLTHAIVQAELCGEIEEARYFRALLDDTLTPHVISIYRLEIGEQVARAMARVLHPLDDEHIPGEESPLEFFLRAGFTEVASHLGKVIASMPKSPLRQDFELLGRNLADVQRVLAHPGLLEDLNAARAIYGFDPVQH